MGFIKIKCSECGANIKIDDSKETGKCPNCDTTFVREKKEIKNIINNNKTINIGTQINLNSETVDEEKLEEQLFSLMQNFNFEKAENFSLRILEKKPNNPLANLVLKSNFNIKSFFEITFISFNYSIVTNYFKTHCGKINLDVCLYFVGLTLKNEGSSFNNQELLNNIFTNVESLEIDKNEIIKFYKNVFDLISLNKTNIQTLREEGKKLKKAAWANILLTQTAGVSATINYEGKKALEVADSVESATKDVEAIVKNFIITESVFKDDLNNIQQKNGTSYNIENKRPNEDDNENQKVKTIASILILFFVLLLFIGSLLLN